MKNIILVTFSFLAISCSIFLKMGMVKPLKIENHSGQYVDFREILDAVYAIQNCVGNKEAVFVHPLKIVVVPCERKDKRGLCYFDVNAQRQGFYGKSKKNGLGQAIIKIPPDLAALKHELVHVMPYVLGLRGDVVKHGDPLFKHCTG